MAPPGVRHPVKFLVHMWHQQKLPAHPRQCHHYPLQLPKPETMFLPKITSVDRMGMMFNYLSCWNSLSLSKFISSYSSKLFQPTAHFHFAKVTRRVLNMLQKGMIDAAAAREILGKLPEETSGSKDGGQKRALEKPLGHGGSSDPDSDDFDKSLDEFIQESKKQKLETLLQEQLVCLSSLSHAIMILLYIVLSRWSGNLYFELVFCSSRLLLHLALMRMTTP